MARVPYLDKHDLPPEYQELLNRSINVTRALVHSPKAARKFGALGNYIRHGSTLDSRLSEMAIIQVGYLTRQPYEYSHHVKIGMDMGVSEDDIIGGGGSDKPEFSAALWAEWCADRPDFWEPIATALLEAYKNHARSLADAAKK